MFLSRRDVTFLIAAGCLAAGLGAIGIGAAAVEPPTETGVLRDGFETGRVTWQREYTDATVRLLAHERSDRAAHGGKLSEHFLFDAGAGSRFYVSEALPNLPVTEDLSLSVYVRSNQSGAQLFGWVVLPADIDPDTKAPSYLLVPGTVFSRPDRWEKLELVEIGPAIEEQARILRASTRRPVSLKGAYLARVVLNLLGGQGQTDVFVDDLQVGPVPRAVADAWTASRSRPDAPGAAEGAPSEKGRAENDKGQDESTLPAINLTRGVFEKLSSDRRYLPWFPVAIDAPGANPQVLRSAGFDVLVTDEKPDPKKIQPVLDRGMFLLPRLSGANQEDGPRRVLDAMAAFPLPGAVLMWSIGEHLGNQRQPAARLQEVEQVREALAAIHESDDELHLATATVEGEFRLYARSPSNLDVIGVDLPIWGTSRSLTDGLEYLVQRRSMTARSNPEALFWAWLPATIQPTVIRNIWGGDEVPSWGRPPVQPEQLRLMTYMALGGGCRGVTFVGDADLTRPAGEILLTEMTFLNAEIDMFEDILARNVEPITDYHVYDPDPAERPTTANVNLKRLPLVKELGHRYGLHAAAVPLKGGKGALLLVADLAPDALWQPPQMAYHDLVINPRLPQNVQFMEVSPGDVRFLEQKFDDRIPGGTRVSLTDFGTSTILLCTTDLALCERVRRHVRSIQPIAARMAIRQAELQYASVVEVHERLKSDGHIINNDDELEKRARRGIEGKATDANDLMVEADRLIKSAHKALEDSDYGTAWGEARRASRPLRHVMSGYWQQAMAELRKAVEESFNGPKIKYPDGVTRPYPRPPVLVTAASCPPAVSFYTLPQLHIWKDWARGVHGYRFGPNLVPSGSFDEKDDILTAGWSDVSHQYDQIVKKIEVPLKTRAPVWPRKDLKPKKKGASKSKNSEIKYEQEPLDPADHVLMLTVEPKEPKDLKFIDKLPPQLDFPVAAIRSPSIRVGANNLIRISVLVKRPLQSVPGKGGLIIHDSIGGDQFQFRSTDPIGGYARVVLYRKAPVAGTFHVTLGLAGYGTAYFDDFRVEVIEEDAPAGRVDPGLVQQRRPAVASPRLPDPRVPADTAARNSVTVPPR